MPVRIPGCQWKGEDGAVTFSLFSGTVILLEV
jgi:hypothetical protein